MTKPFKMDLLLQHSSGAHSAGNDAGRGPKRKKGRKEDGLYGSTRNVSTGGFSLPRLMEKWKNVSSLDYLTPLPHFFFHSKLLLFLSPSFFFHKLKVTIHIKSSQRKVGGLRWRQEDQKSSAESGAGGHVLWPDRQNVGLSSNKRIYGRYQEV